MLRRVIVTSAVLVLALMPAVAFAAPSWLPIVQCGGHNPDGSAQPLCTPCDMFALGHRIIDAVLYGITGPIAAFMIVVAGGMMLLGGANPTQFSNGKKLLTNTLIGCAIILLAWLFTNFLIKSLGNGNAGDTWYQFSCPAELQRISKLDTEFSTGAPVQPVPVPQQQLQPAVIGVTSAATSQNLCATGPSSNKAWTCSSCELMKPDKQKTIGEYIQQYGADIANVMEAIMYAESSCRSVVGPTGDYGLMQLQPDTARKYQETCDVYFKTKDGKYADPGGNDSNGVKYPIPIDSGFLLSAQNTKYVVCIGAAYIHELQRGPCGPKVRNIAAGYNTGSGWCGNSNACSGMQSCSGGPMQKWECPWDDREHTQPNKGFQVTRSYAPKVEYCAAHLQ